MKKLIIDDGVIIGATMDENYAGDVVDAPEGFVYAEMSDYDLVEGAVVLNVDRHLDRKRQAAVGRLNEDYTSAVTALRSDYPEAETMTWTLQVTEATAYRTWVDGGRKGNAPITPFVTALSTARDAAGVGDGFDDLVTRILGNDAVFTPAMATVTAKRHAAELEIRTAPDAASVLAVAWSLAP